MAKDTRTFSSSLNCMESSLCSLLISANWLAIRKPRPPERQESTTDS